MVLPSVAKLKVGFVKQESHSPWANFLKGGDMATKMNPGMMAMMAKKKGAPAKKMAGSGFTRSADGVASKGKTKATQIKMKSGGMAC